MTLFQKARRVVADWFFTAGQFVYYYVPIEAALYEGGEGADVSIWFPVSSNKDYDDTTTKVFDVIGDLLEAREWTGSSRLDHFEEDE